MAVCIKLIFIPYSVVCVGKLHESCKGRAISVIVITMSKKSPFLSSSGTVRVNQTSNGFCGGDYYYSVLESPWLEFTVTSCLKFRYKTNSPAALDVFVALHNGSVITILDRTQKTEFDGNVASYSWTINAGIGKVMFYSSVAYFIYGMFHVRDHFVLTCWLIYWQANNHSLVLYRICFCLLSWLFLTVHEKTRCKSEIAILDNAHLMVQTLCYFMLKSDLPNGDKITSVWDNACLFSACYSSLLLLISSAET